MTLVWITSSHAAVSGESTGITPEIPALLTTISILPNRSTMRRMPASTLFGSRMSIVKASDRSCGKSRIGDRAQSATSAPSWWSFLAIAKPMPRLAPVIMATLFMDINGKVALITGAAKRIGKEIALDLARRGARLAVHYRSSEAEAKKVAGTSGVVFQADLRDIGAVEEMFQGIAAKLGGLDILINSASVFSAATADDATPDHWDLQMDTNAKAPFFVAQRAARLMRARGAGKIINIADVAGEGIWHSYLPYSVSKAALIALT